MNQHISKVGIFLSDIKYEYQIRIIILLPLYLYKLFKMSINGIVYFLKDLFYSTFEVLPMIGWAANYLFLVIMFLLFVYWLTVLNKTAKSER